MGWPGLAVAMAVAVAVAVVGCGLWVVGCRYPNRIANSAIRNRIWNSAIGYGITQRLTARAYGAPGRGALRPPGPPGLRPLSTSGAQAPAEGWTWKRRATSVGDGTGWGFFAGIL